MSNPVTLWLDAAGRYPLLSASETIRIARKVQGSEPGSAERSKWVNKLCLHNLRLVVKFTKSYLSGDRRLSWGDDRVADYLQQGYFGLRRAAEKFDPERGYAFATYANAWVRQALGRYHVDNLSMIRVPESSAREIFYYDNHGEPRNEKVSKWVASASRDAKSAYCLTSYDAQLEADLILMDTLSDENRVRDNKSSDEPSRVIDTAGIMGSLGIEPRIQDLVMAYIKRGNLDTVLMKNKCCSTETRRLVRGAIAKIQEHCGAVVG